MPGSDRPGRRTRRRKTASRGCVAIALTALVLGHLPGDGPVHVAWARALASPPADPVVASAAGKRRCRDVIYRTQSGVVYSRTHGLSATRTSCRRARRVAYGWLSNAEGNVERPRPLGFRCKTRSDGTGMSCRKNRAIVRWRYQ